ncbi:MAG: nicotinate-nucleotide diphosphorylase (carboxylating) [Candidatus Omnitrophica bacterium 4484_171]|nr:MAG: nicotinate-nucleotide diphosphorylase (carboxylating) [Candidatus Omnitrophica bacterium 4484_171]
MRYLDNKKVDSIVKEALREDIGRGDVTTSISISDSIRRRAFIISKERGVLCGIDIARKVFKNVDASVKFNILVKEGSSFKKDTKIAVITGKASSVLRAERVALNFLYYLSGIAAYTRKFADRVKGTKIKIMDTRKTTPTLRFLEKYAVRVGGGYNHRFGLWDGVIIKDNHLKAFGIVKKRLINESRLEKLITVLRRKTNLPVEIEVESIKELKAVMKYKPDIVMLDNFKPSQLRKAVQWRNSNYPGIKLEASGGINLKNIGSIAKTGVDFISIGALTHSAPCIDYSLEISDE